MSHNDVLLAQMETVGERSLFFHVCCGPCAEWPLTFLSDAQTKVTGYFYNPNIHPTFERERRLEYAQRLMSLRGLYMFVEGDGLQEDWESAAWLAQGLSRCEMCYKVRLRNTAKTAAEQGFSFFSTSLFVSPYQNREKIIEAGFAAAAEFGLTFLDFDFRDGFRRGQEMAKADGLYRQKYCGCVLSLEESTFRDRIIKDFPEYRS